MADTPARMEDSRTERDLLLLAKVVGASDFPVERPAVIGVDRESGGLLRLVPFPWKGVDTDPPLLRWSWIHAPVGPSTADPRPESSGVVGEVTATAYVDPKDGWRLRWPFVRPHVHPSLEELQQRARDGAGSLGFIRPAADADILQLPLRLRFRCDAPDCGGPHDLPVLDWELHEMARASRERFGPQWATKFRQTWGAPLFERYDVHLLLSSYAQSLTRFYVAGLFYPPRTAEDPHEHMHHAEHRKHREGGGESAPPQ